MVDLPMTVSGRKVCMFHMCYEHISDQGLHKLADNRCETDRPVI